MVRFVTTRGHDYTLRELTRSEGGPPVRIEHYDEIFRTRRLPRSTWIFTDMDRLGAWDLELAAAVHRSLAAAGLRVLNDPARVKARWALLRALHEAGLNEFNAYRLDEGVRPQRYPVFLRKEGGHGAPLSDLLDDWPAVARAAEGAIDAGIPASSLIVVEYAAEPAAPGLFRKLSMTRVADRLLAHPSVHDRGWLVKYGRRGGATAELYAEESRWVAERPFAEPVMRAFEIAGIEFGRADFGLVRGRPQIYEINTNPDVRILGPHPSPVRMETQRLCWEQLLDALGQIDERASGPPVHVSDRRLRPYRHWRARADRARFVP